MQIATLTNIELDRNEGDEYAIYNQSIGWSFLSLLQSRISQCYAISVTLTASTNRQGFVTQGFCPVSRSLAISAIGEASDLGSQLEEKKLVEPPNLKINITDTQRKARSSQVMVLLSLLLRHDNTKLYIASFLFSEGQCTL